MRRFYGSRLDGTEELASFVAPFLKQQHRILDLGCGRGRKEMDFRSRCRLVVGCDYANSIRYNPCVSARVMGDAYKLPFSNQAFDAVVMDFVLEHLSIPKECAEEISRVLKPGGALFFRTPNLYHYVGIIAFLTPHWLHDKVVRNLTGSPSVPHKTYYRINTQGAVKRILAKANLVPVEIRMVEKEPSYLMFSAPAFFIGYCYERLVNKFDVLASFRSNIFGYFRKVR